MKTDLALQEDVAEELSFDPSVDASDIGVAAKDGVVTLTGKVPSYAQKIAAERATKRVAGVKALAMDLTVELPGIHQRSDAEIAAAALNTLAWEITVPRDAVTVKVERGWLTLEGRTDWLFVKENAERAVRNLIGVTGVSNQITVAPHPTSGDVLREIKKTFERNADIDATRITAETHDGIVTLRGPLHSLHERDYATRAAYTIPGVKRVDNLTTISV